jgi:hypothetical protein
MFIGFGIVVVVAVLLMYSVASLAERKARSQLGWAAAIGITGALGWAAGWFVFESFFERDQTVGGSNLLLFASLTPGVFGFGLMLATIVFLRRLPPLISRETSCPVYRQRHGAEVGGDGMLTFGPDELRFETSAGPPLVLPWAAVIDAVADGEGVRVRWRQPDASYREPGGGEPNAFFVPGGRGRTREWRMAQSVALARRIKTAGGSGA